MYIMGKDESIFKDASQIKPERWIRSSSSKHQHNPFSFTPFGFGPRMCIGRRVAELEMELLLARVCFYHCIDSTAYNLIILLHLDDL